MRRTFLLTFALSWLASLSIPARASVDSLLNVLDETLTDASRYEAAKLARIDHARAELRALPPASLDDEFMINRQLYEEYETYICDSARHYVNRNLEIARLTRRTDLLNETLLEKATILNRSGLYAESVALLRSIDPASLAPDARAAYYINFEETYLYYAEYTADDEYQPAYLDKLYAYRDTVLSVVPKGSYRYVCAYAPYLLQQGREEEAIALLQAYLPSLGTGTRDYAVLTSILAFGYQQMGDEGKRKEYLIRSAIADIRGVVKENNSLRALSEMLYDEGQLERANRYMKRSIEDANFYNARLRNVQAARMLPVIDHAYQAERVRQANTVRLFLALTAALAIFLAGAVWYVVRQMKKLVRVRRELLQINDELQRLSQRQRQLNDELQIVNAQLHDTNLNLAEANRIKEEYVARFMDQCSAYIDKLETYRRTLNKQAVTGKTKDLYDSLKSTSFVDEELKAFYQNFDNSFLNIFPHFVEQFNALLPPEEQIPIHKNERLTTELRIFALIRLGITDSAKIASFLRYSITTIYTYRSKLKNRSLRKERFEEEVMKIGVIQ
ncbi:MAG: DUF6377 domain-containing protein [Mediterranea sp.]|jgi:hypothetical protein|nr:DUF6377 domain-containing protein [Mediterranea sp.]